MQWDICSHPSKYNDKANSGTGVSKLLQTIMDNAFFSSSLLCMMFEMLTQTAANATIIMAMYGALLLPEFTAITINPTKAKPNPMIWLAEGFALKIKQDISMVNMAWVCISIDDNPALIPI